jgi:hypothetical protein
MKTTKLIILSTVAILLSSCFTAKQMNKAITKSVSEDVIKNVQVSDPNVVLNTEKLVLFTPSAKVTTIHNYFIPALFYWETRDLLLAEINNRAYINNFTEVLNRKAIENNFAEKLKGKKLEISLEATPNEFYYDYQHIIIYLVFAYSQSFYADIYGKNQEFKISYRVMKDDLEIKNGSFSTPFTRKSPKGMAWSESQGVAKYVEFNRAEFITASETLIQLIANEL